jgi:hypothetical protein
VFSWLYSYSEKGYYDLIPSHVLNISQKLKTRVVRKSVNPEWNDELTLSIEDPTLLIKLVCVTLSFLCFVIHSHSFSRAKHNYFSPEKNTIDLSIYFIEITILLSRIARIFQSIPKV